MDHSKFIPRLKKVHLFHGLSEDQLLKLILDAKEVSLLAGEYLFREGDHGRSFFFIEEGEVEVLKTSPSDGSELIIAHLKEGDVVGEMAFIKGARRDASIKTTKPTRFLDISIHPNENDFGFLELKSRISDLLAERLRRGNKIVTDQIIKILEHSNARAGLGNLIVHLLALIFLYIYAIRFISVLKIPVLATPIISAPVLSIFAFSMYLLIKNSAYPVSLYGLTLKGASRSFWEGILFSIPVILFITFLRWVIIHTFPAFRQLDLFHFLPLMQNKDPSFNWSLFFGMISLYGFFVPIQEFIYRGVIQGSLQQFLLGKHRTLQAILISNLPYSMIHLHLSFSLTLSVYFFGLFWGWMYERHQSLVGCTVSHFFIGIYAFFILGIEDILIV